MVNCLHCDKETNNPKYCSRSCAASINNSNTPKRQPEGECCICGCLQTKRRKYCNKCFHSEFSAKDITLKEAIYEKHHRSSAYALVRSRARSVCKTRDYKCEVCQWDHHVEVCHIKPISAFPEETLISEINSESNLIILCPNCHWDFDHKFPASSD